MCAVKAICGKDGRDYITEVSVARRRKHLVLNRVAHLAAGSIRMSSCESVDLRWRIPAFCLASLSVEISLWGAWGCYIRALMRSLGFKFSIFGLIYTMGASDVCLAQSTQVGPKLKTH